MSSESKRDAASDGSAAKRAAAAAAAGFPNPALFLSADVGSPYAASAASALAMAAGGGAGNALLRSPPFMGAPGLGSSAPPSPGSGDNSSLLSLYQSPLWQAALRQQQIQLISHIASLSNPFLSAAAQMHTPPAPPPPPQSLPPSFTSSLEAAQLYREYLSKYAAQVSASSASTTATSSTTHQRHPSTSATTSTTSSSSAKAAMAMAANLMAAAGGKPTSSDHFGSASSTTLSMSSGLHHNGPSSVRLSSEKHSPTFLDSTSRDRSKDNNNGKSRPSPESIFSSMVADSPPSSMSIPTSIAPLAQSIISAGRGQGSGGRGRGRAKGSNPSGQGGGQGGSPGSSGGIDPYNGRDKVFTCKICNRSFGYKHVLQNHERTHTGEKPFECRVCHKRFTRDHHLKTHMRLHTGEKPYNCTHCDRQFVQVANLRRHLRVHTGEKPYKCDLCDSTFSDSNQLKAHVLIHKGEKPFSCDKCEAKFRRRHHLMHHACPLGGRNMGSSGIGTTFEDDDDMESLTSPSSDSFHLDQPASDDAGQELAFAAAAKKFRALSSPNFDAELEKKYLSAAGPGSKPPSGLELSLMLAAAAAAAAAESSDKQRHSSNAANAARSRKSRDPKRVRPSADQSPKSDEASINNSVHGNNSSDDGGKNETKKNNYERSAFQTEPEDLSSSRRQIRLDVQNISADREEKETLTFDDLDVSTSSDRIGAAAAVSSTTDGPTAMVAKMPIVN